MYKLRKIMQTVLLNKCFSKVSQLLNTLAIRSSVRITQLKLEMNWVNNKRRICRCQQNETFSRYFRGINLLL